jgi:outer membrane immunogenic protein
MSIIKTETVSRTLALIATVFCTATVVFTTPANAGSERYSSKDKNVQMTQAPEPFNWTGIYVGGQIGGSATDFDFSGYSTDVDVDAQLGGTSLPFASFVTFDTPALTPGSASSLIGGGQLGYQHQWGHFVIGVEGDFNGMSAQSESRFQPATIFSTSNFGFDTETNLQTTRQAEMKWIGSARAKLGWASGPVLLYVTGGVAFADATLANREVARTDFFDQGSGMFVFNVTTRDATEQEKVITGWTGGAGAEWAFTNIASMALEYRHNAFDDESYAFARKAPVFPGSTRLGLDEDQVVLKVNFLLGRIGK